MSAAAWARNDARRKPDEVFLRLVVPHPGTDAAIGFLEVSDLNTTGFKMEDVCEVNLAVGHEYRQRGIGAMLYDLALAFAQERGAKRLLAGFQERTPNEPAISFLTRRGFAEQERETPSYLDLAQWDAAPYASSLAQAAAYGAEIFTFAEAGDTEEKPAALLRLRKAADLRHPPPRRAAVYV